VASERLPLGRAVGLGARRVFVLQVGRIEQKPVPPRNPWEVLEEAARPRKRCGTCSHHVRVGSPRHVEWLYPWWEWIDETRAAR
jgi:hypothetical protein